MTLRKLLEDFGLDVEELLNTEVGKYKRPGETFNVNARISSGPSEPGSMELIITTLLMP